MGKSDRDTPESGIGTEFPSKAVWALLSLFQISGHFGREKSHITFFSSFQPKKGYKTTRM